MSRYVQLPARLDVETAQGDLTTAVVTVTDGTNLVDVSGWDVRGFGVDVDPVDANSFRLTWPTRWPGGDWRVVRFGEPRRALIAGKLSVSKTATGKSSETEWTLVLEGDSPITLEVTGGGGGGASELDDLTDVNTAGGTEGQVLTLQADGTYALATPAGGGDLSATDVDTLAKLNTVVTDATLDDAGDPRDPNAHAASHATGQPDAVGPADIGAYPDTNPDGFVDTAGAAAAAPVQSVNSETGVVDLDAGDVGAAPAAAGVPEGGDTGGLLRKASGTDFDTEWTDNDAYVSVLRPSGDTTGSTDSDAINAAANVVGAHVMLAVGEWYVSHVGLTTNEVWLQGSGNGTVLNVVGENDGITVTGPGDLTVSNLSIKNGEYGLTINGAYDANFRNLRFEGQSDGGIRIDGDLATEQHFTHIVMRGVGGVGFGLYRTTWIYTGSVYLDRVRLVEPPTSATHGFLFQSTADDPSLNIGFFTQCVADNYAGDGAVFENVAQLFVASSWFAINGDSPSGSAALKIIGGFQQTFVGNYTYSFLSEPTVILEGDIRGVDIGGGHVFDGEPGSTALGVAGKTTPGGFTLGTHQNNTGTLADIPGKVALPQPPLPGYTGRGGQETFHRMLCNSSAELADEQLVLTYFTSTKDEVVSAVEAMTNDPASGQTYCGYGLYEVDDNNTLTLIAKAEQDSSPNLWNSGYQPIGGFDTRLGFTHPAGTIDLKAGQKYAIGALFTGTTAPKLIANLASSGTSQSNVNISGTPLGALSGKIDGQTTLGTVGSTTHTEASVDPYGWVPYFVIL